MMKWSDFIKSKGNLFDEVYGFLLNCSEKTGVLCAGGLMKTRGEIKETLYCPLINVACKDARLCLISWKLEIPLHVYYSKVYEVDKKAFHAIMIREMGLETIRKFMCVNVLSPMTTDLSKCPQNLVKHIFL
jgi:hypothetical protein